MCGEKGSIFQKQKTGVKQGRYRVQVGLIHFMARILVYIYQIYARLKPYVLLFAFVLPFYSGGKILRIVQGFLRFFENNKRPQNSVVLGCVNYMF